MPLSAVPETLAEADAALGTPGVAATNVTQFFGREDAQESIDVPRIAPRRLREPGEHGAGVGGGWNDMRNTEPAGTGDDREQRIVDTARRSKDLNEYWRD